ncbi:MAG: siderophore-interacting protein [Paracoccaceae bacterium]|nr:siderophore-interacting protein [Paracoccaceae bacterium]
MTRHIVLGQLMPVTWPALEGFARALSTFCSVHVAPNRVISSHVGPGNIEITWRARRASLRLDAGSEAGLQNLRDTLGHLLEEVEEGLSARLDWQAEGNLEGRLPPNFRSARVSRVTRLSRGFMRLRLEAEDLGYLAQNGLHLRLLQPTDPDAPVWPRLNRNGRTVWPGASDLHMPVYTIRAIDPAQGWLDVDVFLHGHGRTCAWALQVRAGARVGLTGPGGGWLPRTPTLWLGGDETALPAVARILHEASPDTQGHAMLTVSDAANILPLDAPPGVQVEWLVQGRDAASRDEVTAHLTRSAARCLTQAATATIQFAGEKSVAQAIRASLQRITGKLPANVTCAAYWTRTA